MDRKSIKILINKLEKGILSSYERKVLENWYHDIAYKDAIYPDNENVVENRIYKRLTENIDSIKSPKTKINYEALAVAAVIIILFGFLSIFTLGDFIDFKNLQSKNVINDIVPIQSQSILTLSDGKVIKLDKESNGIIINGTISYNDGKVISQNLDGPITLTVPKGGIYFMLLEDGSKVWLNSDSKLFYPMHFAANKREVKLIGEGYFKITKDAKKPFIVKSKNQDIKVFGTEFNINAYSENSYCLTTLINGKVQVFNSETKTSRFLKPGEQSQVSNEHTKVLTVDINPIIAWKDGFFNFEGKDLKTILKEFERWYDIEVIYEGTIPKVDLFGDINKNVNLSFALKILESAGIKYELNGRILKIGEAH